MSSLVDAGLKPSWNEVMFFKVQVPELAFVIFTVLVKNVVTAQYTISYKCLQQGEYIYNLGNAKVQTTYVIITAFYLLRKKIQVPG